MLVLRKPKMFRKILNNFMVAYIVVAYFIMFSILWQNRSLDNKCHQNTLELMTASAPITIIYLLVKNATGEKQCKGIMRVSF